MTAAHLYTAKGDGHWWSGNTKGAAWSSGGGDPDPGGSSTNDWSDTNLPWTLKAGESLTDNMPSGVTTMSYDDYDAGDFGATMTAIRNAATGPYVVQMGAGTYHITSFMPTWSGAGAGWFDGASNKYWCGNIGKGADKTIIELDGEVMTAAQVQDIATAVHSPTAYYALYLDSPVKPAFFSGITFRGNFQQVTSLSGLSGQAPAPYDGLHMSHLPAGSMIQYCRFQGFAFAAKNSPPYELAPIGSSYSTYTVRRTEIDGRIAPEIDQNRPRASGGFMPNYETGPVALEQVWLHHTRQSAWAVHDHSGSNTNDTGQYSGTDVKVENVSRRDPSDTWATDGQSFCPSNTESVRNTFTWTRCHLTTDHPTKAHITLLLDDGDTMANSLSVEDFSTDNTDYNGCLVFALYQQGGKSPYYIAYQQGGAAALPLTVTKDGVTLTGVDAFSEFNASQHFPDQYYVIRPS